MVQAGVQAPLVEPVVGLDHLEASVGIGARDDVPGWVLGAGARSDQPSVLLQLIGPGDFEHGGPVIPDVFRGFE